MHFLWVSFYFQFKLKVFPVEIKGEFYIGPAKGMLMVNMDTGDEETIVYVRKQ